jgi:hypothetical protein
VGAEDQAEVLGANHVFGDPMVRKPELLTRIVHVASQDADSVREVGPGPDGQVNEFAMGSPHFRAQVNIDFGRSIL